MKKNILSLRLLPSFIFSMLFVGFSTMAFAHGAGTPPSPSEAPSPIQQEIPGYFCTASVTYINPQLPITVYGDVEPTIEEASNSALAKCQNMLRAPWNAGCSVGVCHANDLYAH